MNVITTEIQVFNRALGISLPATVLGKRLHHFRKERWCPNSESNQGHGDFQSPALPTELSGQRGALNLIRLVSSIKFLQFTADCTIYHHFAAIARIVRQTRRSRRRKAALPEGVLEAC